MAPVYGSALPPGYWTKVHHHSGYGAGGLWVARLVTTLTRVEKVPSLSTSSTEGLGPGERSDFEANPRSG
jgi:hypothetical protein